MREPETYWSRKGPPIPEVKDLPEGTGITDERSWESLSPGMRRTVWREAIHREARERGLSEDTISRLKIATIDGGLGSLDEYLMVFERKDERRAAIREDVERIQRADAMQRKSDAQIVAREAL